MSKGRVSPIAEPLVLPHLVLQNRVVRSATANGMADERGYVTAPQVELYRRLAAGGIGLIVTGHCFVCPEGIASPGQTGIHEPGCLPGLTEIASLAGRNVVCGSPSYLYYHGLPYDWNQRMVQAIYQRPAEAQPLLEKLNVEYILLSDFERGSCPAADAQALDRLYPRVYDDGNRILYQVTKQEETP